MKTSTGRPILCATDFSEPAMVAAEVAAVLARKAKSRLVLVHGINERGEIPRRYWPLMVESTRPLLLAEADRLRRFEVPVSEELAGGMPDEGVVQCASEMNAWMMVLGSAGKGSFERWILGSTAERLA